MFGHEYREAQRAQTGTCIRNTESLRLMKSDWNLQTATYRFYKIIIGLPNYYRPADKNSIGIHWAFQYFCLFYLFLLKLMGGRCHGLKKGPKHSTFPIEMNGRGANRQKGQKFIRVKSCPDFCPIEINKSAAPTYFEGQLRDKQSQVLTPSISPIEMKRGQVKSIETVKSQLVMSSRLLTCKHVKWSDEINRSRRLLLI